MLLDVPLCRQTTDFTCGACAALMVRHYFDGNEKLTKRNEFLIWSEIVALPFKFSSPHRIAAYFAKNGFETTLVMKRGTGGGGRILLECCQTDPAERKLFVDFFEAYDKILAMHVTSDVVYRIPTLSDISRALSHGSPVIALVDSYYTTKARGARNPPHLPHWIVVSGYENGRFYINDSISERGLKNGKMGMDERILETAMDTNSRFGWLPSIIIVSGKATESISHKSRKKIGRRKYGKQE